MLNLPPLLNKQNGKDRFWPNVKIDKSLACWPWLKSTSEGYGQVGFGSPKFHIKRAHVVAYELVYGQVPKGMHVHHRCENKLCCNPFHLKLMKKLDHHLHHNPPQICSHGHLGRASCLACDRERKKLARSMARVI